MVLDITGVPIVDSKVANHLVQTVEAVRLMGAQVILSDYAYANEDVCRLLANELRGEPTPDDVA